MDYFLVLERTVLFYVLITVIYRFMGKREVGQLGIVDLIVSILIAELAAMSIDKRTENVFLSINSLSSPQVLSGFCFLLCNYFIKVSS